MATETTLWDINDKRPEKTIYVPEGMENEQIISTLMHGYDVSKLQEAACDVRETFKKYKLVALDKDGKKYEPAPITLMFIQQEEAEEGLCSVSCYHEAYQQLLPILRRMVGTCKKTLQADCHQPLHPTYRGNQDSRRT